MDRLSTALSDRYAIEDELGRGAMAIVYLAKDLKHHRRKVAVKVLRPELAASLGVDRFLREIEIAATLNHPHILPLFDSGQADGFLYYVMPYVQGETLRDKLLREKRLPTDEALEITKAVGGALDYAHSHNVVHRDIKPENILIHEGEAVVADFGIGLAVSAAGGGRLTETGLALGTPDYMSPEQASGETNLDGRSDVYGLGCVLFEMLGGKPPFGGATAREIISRQISAPVPSLRDLDEALPASVDAALTKALAKAPEERFATASQFTEALTAPGITLVTPAALRIGKKHHVFLWSAAVALIAVILRILWELVPPAEAPVALDPNVIAVLPFRVTASDSSYNYLREGIVDLLNARLTGEGVPRAVDSRTALSRYRRAASEGGDLPTAESVELAVGLGAGRVLLGELVVTPTGAEISGRLLGVPNGEILAEHSESGAVSELELVDRFVIGILGLTAGEGTERLSALSGSLPAVKAYLAGLREYRRGELATAGEYFHRALGMDSTFALAALRLVDLRVWVTPWLFEPAVRPAWSLRERLSGQDQALLKAYLGPNYPGPSTVVEYIRQAERAALAAPDRAEAWTRWGTELLYTGAYASIEGWAERATFALDSAIAIDSTWVPALMQRLEAALVDRDPVQIRKFADLYFAAGSAGPYDGQYRWRVARALNDSATLSAIRSGFTALHPDATSLFANVSIIEGIPLDDAEQAAEEFLADPATPSDSRRFHVGSQLRIAEARGRVRQAIALADSFLGGRGTRWARVLITHALVEPGYDGAASRAAQWLTAVEDTTQDPDLPCYAELWRVSQGDTTSTRRVVDRLRRVADQLGVCALLLEAMLESMPSPRRVSPAVDRLESLMKLGADEGPFDLANLQIARWREMQGDIPRALAAVRRRTRNRGYQYLYAVPAYLREEGRLAALAGDTVGAIRAYDHYLTLRDDPDPVMQPEVDAVRAALAALVGERRRER